MEAMDEQDISTDTNISLTIPIRIRYEVLEAYVNKKFDGEIISKTQADGKTSKYAKILDIRLSKSSLPGYNLKISIKLETLTFLYRNKELDLIIHAKLDFDAALQKIYIDKFEIDSQGQSWIADQLLESVVNTLMYQKVKKNLNFELMPAIKEQLSVLNDKLANRLEAKAGVYLTGSLDSLQISHLEAKETEIWILMSIEGWGIVDLETLDFE